MKIYVITLSFFLIIYPFFQYGVFCFFLGEPYRGLFHHFVSGAIVGVLFIIMIYFFNKRKKK